VGCSTVRAGATTLVTASDGSFTLPLDPGRYQIDYDPPAGSSVPRMTEFDVEIGKDDVEREVQLPQARVLEGDVIAADGTPLAGAFVRLYEPRCSAADNNCTGPSRLSPWLRGTAQTDAKGRFRAVVPRPF
jgi:hypothetical protein